MKTSPMSRLPQPQLVRSAQNRSVEGPARDPQSRCNARVWDVLCDHRQSVIRYLRRRCRDYHQAEDLAHDTLIKAARYSDSLRHVARPAAWLMQIAANVQRDHVRREVRHQLAPPGDTLFTEVPGSEPIPGDAPEPGYYSIDGQLVAGDVIVDEVRRAWEAMSVADRTVLSGYYREEGSTRLAAKNCGIDHGLVKIRLFRARKRLEASLRRRLGSS